jgi:hypothetical protein
VRGYGRAASGQQQSSVSGRVVDRNNQPVTGACLYANNSGANTALHCTNDNGEYFIGDLGDSHWSIVLTYIPKPDTLRRQVVGVFDVDGTPGNQAVVNFLER